MPMPIAAGVEREGVRGEERGSLVGREGGMVVLGRAAVERVVLSPVGWAKSSEAKRTWMLWAAKAAVDSETTVYPEVVPSRMTVTPMLAWALAREVVQPQGAVELGSTQV